MKIKFNAGKFIGFWLTVAIIVGMLAMAIDVAMFPECYFTTWRYQLEQDLRAGDEEAIEYYQERYIAHGRYLFGEEE